MINRREFIQTSAAAAVVVSGVGLSASAPPVMVRRSLAAVVFDERFPESTGFATAAARLGLVAHPTIGNVTSLFTAYLDALWRQDRAPVGGLTTADALLCLSELARDYRMRVVYRGEHERQAEGVLHQFTCAQAGFESLIGFERDTSTPWPGRVAQLVSSVTHTLTPLMTKVVTTPHDDVPSTTDGLVSWVIA